MKIQDYFEQLESISIGLIPFEFVYRSNFLRIVAWKYKGIVLQYVYLHVHTFSYLLTSPQVFVDFSHKTWVTLHRIKENFTQIKKEKGHVIQNNG